jgi:hydrogenase expression/formation protein HypC
MQLVEVRDGGTGLVELDGVRHEINLGLLEDPRPGDYLIVHAGFAIEKLDRAEADERLALFAELARVAQEPGRSPGSTGVRGGWTSASVGQREVH